MENQLLNIKINQDDINAAIANAAKARTELDKLKAANKELEKQKKELIKAEGDQSKAIESLNTQISKNSTQIKAASSVVRENEKIVTTNTQAQKANEGSITQLTKQLGIVSQQWAALSKEERENEEIGGKLAKQKLDLTEKLKAEEKATGDTRRNVGNYKDSVVEALNASGGFGKSLVGVVQGLKAATAASLKFLATPLGAVIGALGLALAGVVGVFKTFQASLQRTEKGQGALNKITSVFTGITNGVLKVVEPLATLLADGLAVGFDLVTQAIGTASKAIEKALKFLGLDSYAEGLKGAREEVEKTKDQAQQLVEAETRLNKVRREQEKTQLRFQKQAEELRQIRDDESKSIEERIKANQQLGTLLDEQTKKEKELAQNALDVAKLRAEVEGKSPDNLDAIAEAELKILEIEERITGQRSEQLTNLNSLKKESDEARLKAISDEKDRLKAIEDREKAEQEATDKAIAEKLREEEEKARIEKEFQELVTQRENLRIEEEKVKLAEERAEGLITKEEYEQELLQIELNTLAVANEAAQLAKEEAINNTALTEAERQRIILESEAVILAARKRTAELSIKAEEKGARHTANTEDDKVKQSKITEKELIEGVRNVAREGSVAAKAAGVAQATISTYNAANKALNAENPILGFILAALVTAKGLLNVQRIVSTPTPSFADGGFTGGGYGNADSSGFKPAGIVHEGEYVIKKSMVENPAFSGIINTLETSRLKGYADGGMVARTASTPALEGSQASQLQNTIAMISKVQPIVKVTDINRVSGQAQMVKVSGELS